MYKRIKGICLALIIITLVTGLQPVFAQGREALSHEQIEQIIEEVAMEKNIPSVILKAIAWKESNYRQFNSNGTPLVSRGNIGIMQVNRIHRRFNQNRLKNDIRYNIEAGADILLDRWNATGRIYPTIGDMNPNILEHWYFALWGYNSWVERNNPNVSGDRAYQERIFHIIRTRYNQPVTSIDGSLLPKRGLPCRTLTIPTPEIHHFGDLNDDHLAIFRDIINHPQREYIEKLHEMGIVNGIGNQLFNPEGFVTKEQAVRLIINALGLQLSKDTSAANQLQEVSDWAEEYIATAIEYEIIENNRIEAFIGDEIIKKEEVLSMLYQGLKKVINVREDLIFFFGDFKLLNPQNKRAIEYFIYNEVITFEDTSLITSNITRGDLCRLIYKTIQVKERALRISN